MIVKVLKNKIKENGKKWGILIKNFVCVLVWLGFCQGILSVVIKWVCYGGNQLEIYGIFKVGVLVLKVGDFYSYGSLQQLLKLEFFSGGLLWVGLGRKEKYREEG